MFSAKKQIVIGAVALLVLSIAALASANVFDLFSSAAEESPKDESQKDTGIFGLWKYETNRDVGYLEINENVIYCCLSINGMIESRTFRDSLGIEDNDVRYVTNGIDIEHVAKNTLKVIAGKTSMIFQRMMTDYEKTYPPESLHGNWKNMDHANAPVTTIKDGDYLFENEDANRAKGGWYQLKDNGGFEGAFFKVFDQGKRAVIRFMTSDGSMLFLEYEKVSDDAPAVPAAPAP